VRSTK